MDYVSGEILTEEGFKSGYVGFEKETLVEIGKDISPKKPVCKGLIVPGFVNAHTHIGDSFIRKKNIELPRNIEELVAPPHGLKHQLLNKASNEEIVVGMKESINDMIKAGVSCFCDFRENGIHGVQQLKEALKDTNVSSLILSRPEKLNYDRDEVESLLDNCDGIGVSGVSDWVYSDLQKLAKHVRSRGKMFALHASERVREDIDLVLDLKPSFLVHMLCATGDDLECVKDNDIPIVVCPRSNSFYSLKPDFELLKNKQVDVLVGTDNAMLNSTSVLDEIKYIMSISSSFSKEELLYMTTYGARKALNLDCAILGPNLPAEFVVLDKKSLKPLYISIDGFRGMMCES